jgi:DNA replication protein DnaC
LPKLTSREYAMTNNRLINDELDPEPLMLSMHASSLISQLNSGKKSVFDTITACALSNSPAFFFVCGHGGTGKTFLWNAIVARLHSEKNSSCRCIVGGGVLAAT